LAVTALGVHISFWISLETGLLDPLFNDAVHRLPRGFDFFAVYQKSYELTQGLPLYRPVDYDALVVPYAAPNYRYLPSWAWVFSMTLGRLPPMLAYTVWILACEIALFGCIFALWDLAKTRTAQLALAVLWLAWFPYYVELFTGQFTFMTAAFITLFLCAFERGREWRAALWLLASIAIKYVGVILLLPLLAVRRHAQVAAIIGAVLAICVLYFLPHSDQLSSFLGLSGSGSPYEHHAGNVGLVGLLGAMARLVPVLRAPLVYGIPLAVVVCLLWASARYREEQSFVPLCLLFITGYFLVGADVYEHHYVLLLPVLSFAYLRSPSPVLFVIWIVLALPTVFWWVDVPGLPHQRFVEVESVWWEQGMIGRILLHHAWKPLPTLVLFVWLLRLLQSETAGTRSEESIEAAQPA
jgi:hypothetical protein